MTHFVLLWLTVTAYRAVPEQTKPECRNRNHCRTAINENVSELGVAISQDLLRTGVVHYRDVVYIEGIGYRIINDTMNARLADSLDIFVYTKDEEKAIGVHRRKVYILKGAPDDL